MKLLGLTKKEIQKVFQKGHSLSDGLFVIKALSSANFQACVTFSKKIKLNKPQKNRIKRQIKAIISQQEISKHGFQLVIILLKFNKEDAQAFQKFEASINDISKQLLD